MFPKLAQYIDLIKRESASLPEARMQKLDQLAEFIRIKMEANEAVKLLFVCPHNSRRSQMAQVWTAAMAHYYRFEGVQAFSGGTEATAFNPRALEALQRAGFIIETSGENNSECSVFIDERQPLLTCFSKRFDHRANPLKNFAAVMTCSEADAQCPFIPGAALRVSLPYDDPKEADGLPREADVYDQRCRQIAGEINHLFSQLN